MGEELRGILENQRQLEIKFENLTLEGGVAGLKDHAHSLSATTQGEQRNSANVECMYMHVLLFCSCS